MACQFFFNTIYSTINNTCNSVEARSLFLIKILHDHNTHERTNLSLMISKFACFPEVEKIPHLSYVK